MTLPPLLLGGASPIPGLQPVPAWLFAPGYTPVSEVKEAFQSPLESARRWTVTTTGTGTSNTITAGQLVQAQTTTDATARETLVASNDPLSLRESAAFVQLAVATFGTAVGGGEIGFVLINNGEQLLYAVTSDGVLNAFARVGGVDQPNVVTLTYSNTTHRWLQIRHSGATIYFETAPSTASNPPIASDWVTQGTYPLASFTGGIDVFNTKLYTFSGAAVGAINAKWDGLNMGTGGAVLAGTPAARSTLTADLTAAASAALAATPADVATLAGGLTTSIALAGTPADLATLAGGLTTSIALAATPAAVRTLTGTLTTAIAFAATPAEVNTLSGQMVGAAAAFAATPADIATLTGGLTTAIPLIAAPADIATLSGGLTTVKALAATPADVATLAGGLTTAIPLIAAPADLATLAGGLTTSIRLAGTPATVQTLTGGLTTSVAFVAAPTEITTLTAALTAGSGLSTTTAAVSTMTGALTTAIRFAATPAAVPTLAAALLVRNTTRFVAALGQTCTLRGNFTSGPAAWVPVSTNLLPTPWATVDSTNNVAGWSTVDSTTTQPGWTKSFT